MPNANSTNLGGVVKPKYKPGSGALFAAMTKDLVEKGFSKKSAGAIAASRGRAKYGKKKFQAMALAGRKKK